MIRNYFLIAWRNLVKQKFYSAIKIGGFAVGIAACLLISLFIIQETSYDQQIQGGDRVFRVVGVNKEANETDRSVSFPAPFAAALKSEFPEIETVGRLNNNSLFTGGGNLIRRPDQTNSNYEEGFTFADPSIIDLLKIRIIYGNPEQALQEPGSVVISRKISEKYFPGENPVGKTLVVGDNTQQPVLISAVMENFPENSHLHFDFLSSLKERSFWKGEQTTWLASNYHTYFRVKPGVQTEGFGQKILNVIFDKYLVAAFRQDGNDVTTIQNIRNSLSLEIQPLRNIYIESGIRDSLSHGDIRVLWLFGAIAAFILLLAMINFINLSTAKAANRAKEVGIRKAVGSVRHHLIQQFLSESMVFSMLSFGCGLLLAAVFLPFFNQLSGKSLSIPWSNAWWIGIIFATACLTGIIAGLYPAFYLSGFRPVQVLKGNSSSGSGKSFLRSSLVVFQFTISIGLIIGTIMIARQMNFILNARIGFEKGQVMLLQGTGSVRERVESFKHQLKKIPGVREVSVSDYLPVSGLGSRRNSNEMWEMEKGKNMLSAQVQVWNVDPGYIPTMGMQLKEGRNFSEGRLADKNNAVINETMAANLNLKNPVGAKITNGYDTLSVIGVVKDFNFESLRTKIGNVCLRLRNSPSITAIKIGGKDVQGTITAIHAEWKQFSPGQPFRYSFLDEAFERMYADIQKVKTVLLAFSVMAVLVACLGLFALASFMAEQRRKEIGIRKVLGASVGKVSLMLTQEFVKLVMVALLIASPLAYYFIHRWLEDFEYQAKLSWWIFALAGISALIIALLTVGYQALKAARANPVKSLRSE